MSDGATEASRKRTTVGPEDGWGNAKAFDTADLARGAVRAAHCN